MAAGSTWVLGSGRVEFIVFLDQKELVIENMAFDNPQIVRRNSAIVRKLNRRKPKLTFAIARADMNVRRFHSFIGIEMKPKRADAQHSWHSHQTVEASRTAGQSNCRDERV